MKFVASAQQRHRFNLVQALSHKPLCANHRTLLDFDRYLDGSSDLKAGRRRLLSTCIECYACAASWHLLYAFEFGETALEKECYVSNVLNEAGLRFLVHHEDLDTWTQDDYNQVIDAAGSQARTDWDAVS